MQEEYEKIKGKNIAVFQKLAKEFGCDVQDVIIKHIFSEGKSRDFVLLVCITQSFNNNRCGNYVLKIFHEIESSAREGILLEKESMQEIVNTLCAAQNEMADSILIPKLHSFSIQPAYYLYDVAGDELLQASSLAKVDPQALRPRLEALSDELLSGWNHGFQIREGTVYQMIVDWLGTERLKNDSRICERIREQITDEWTDSFRFSGRIYPNPLYYIANEDTILAKESARLDCAVYGQMHGDLNLNNVIVQLRPGNRGYQFFMIDFDQYRPMAPLLFDHAYLLFCALLNGEDEWSLVEWCENIDIFFDGLLENACLPSPNKPPYSYMQAVMDGVKRFIVHQQAHNRSAIMRQMLAAHVAVGLNFVNKRDSSDRRQKLALLYAATAMRALLATMDYVVAERENSPELQTHQGQIRDSGLWRLIEHFSPDNRYFLLMSGMKEYITEDQLINLSVIGWSMVLEINGIKDNPVRDSVLPAYKGFKGYRVYEIPTSEKRSYEAAPAWIHIHIPMGKPNLALHYERLIRGDFREIAKKILSMRENEPLVIIADLSGIPTEVHTSLLNDILFQAGENTPIKIICLCDKKSEFESEGMLQCESVRDNLADLSNMVYSLQGHKYARNEIRIPGKDGYVSISPEMAANLSNDMTFVYRNMINDVKDDNGEGFYHGNEATWVDIANGRDVPRLDYMSKWKARLESELRDVSTGSGSVVNLFHRAGGGGTTLSMRIAWDFCASYPTVFLRIYSDQTAERLKELYSRTIKPIFVIVEASDGEITLDGISSLRRELIQKDIRVLFLVVSRATGKENNRNSNNFYLSDTPDLTMSADEAKDMLRRFSACLRNSAGGQEPSDDIQKRLDELDDLTYLADNAELRQPFFYGLYAYGDGFHGISQYVEHNCVGVGQEGNCTLSVLAMLTLFSQSVNLSHDETALFLFPEELPATSREKVKEWMDYNGLVVRRERGIRICHPLVAKEILKRSGLLRELRKKKGQEEVIETVGTNELVNLATQFVDKMVAYYGSDSLRVNSVFRDIFTHREVVDENEQAKFAPLLMMLGDHERCIKVLEHVIDAVPRNPHFSNHMARLYLYPVAEEHYFADTDTALVYAKKAVRLAEENIQEGVSIHYHILGKVYAKRCINILNRPQNNCNLTLALKELQADYVQACRAFDNCIMRDKSGYGLTGKLELYASLFAVIKNRQGSVSEVLKHNEGRVGEISEMISEAGELITRYFNQFEFSSVPFRNACIKFYKEIGNLDKLEHIFSNTSLETVEQGYMNRAVSTVLMEKAIKQGKRFSYDELPEDILKRVYERMKRNICLMTESEQDRVRWLETYRRLPEFNLIDAYQFLEKWPDAENNLFVCYYRYVIAFLMCEVTGEVDYREVRKHLTQAELLSRSAYGKNVSVSLNYYGSGMNSKRLLVPRPQIDGEESKDERIGQNQEFRNKNCRMIHGKIEKIENGMVTIRFHSSDGQGDFFAKTPNVYSIKLEDEGSNVKFFLGFSYSGMRAWDLEIGEN